ncbi:MAG: DNA polymerase I, partial [Rickettsiales bacterium]|nr:DNA polymerase I [Rickettsiales bacterium]
MKKLILIDGYSFLFRAFFAIKGLTRSDGTPVNGLYGFARMLIKIITEIEYTHIAVAFDTGKKTFRNEIYEQYKANRPPCPPELKPQFPLIRELVKTLNIVSLEKIGYEADDIIATFAKKAEKDGFDVIIVSSDKDLMQLVDDKVLMFDGMKNEFIDKTKVKDKWGVEPKQVLDVLSLTGDSSDNVPGVPSIGPKTAAELIEKYSTVENLLEHLDEIKQNKRREVLTDNKDNALLSKRLITLDENIEMDSSLNDLEFKQYDPQTLLTFLKKQEFYSMVKGLEQAFNCVGCECGLFDKTEKISDDWKDTNKNEREINNKTDINTFFPSAKVINSDNSIGKTDLLSCSDSFLSSPIKEDFVSLTSTESNTKESALFPPVKEGEGSSKAPDCNLNKISKSKNLDIKRELNFNIESNVSKINEAKIPLIPLDRREESNAIDKGEKREIHREGNNRFLDREIPSKDGKNIILKNIDDLQDIFLQIKERFYFNIFIINNIILSLTFSIDNKIYFLKIFQDNGDLFSTKNDGFEFKSLINNFKNIFENEKILKIGFNIKKQIKILYQHDISINNFEDIEVLNYISNNGLYDNSLSAIIENQLKNKNEWYLEQEYKKLSIEEKIEILRNLEKKLKNIDIKDKLFELSFFIIEAFNPLYIKLKQQIGNQNLTSIYEDIERPMSKILADMEIEGIKIDIRKLKELSKEFENHSSDLEKDIYKIAGEDFNIGSPKQLSHILFEKLGYASGKKSKAGNYSTGIDILEELANEGCDICEKILLWRHYTKLKNTYTDVLPTMVDKNSRIHTTYSNTDVITGRLNSSNPNLQNIPIKTEAGGKIRSAFVAKDGYKLVAADYKQAELRIIANYQNVKNLKEFFLAGKDIHTTTASKVFKVPEASVTHDMRRIAKAINFSIIYGTGPYGLAKRINSTSDKAKEYLKNYFETYPEVKEYIESAKDFANKKNFTKTLFGRKINIDLANAKPMLRGNLERLSINAPIQGTAADILKIAMIHLSAKLKNLKSKMILQIHDELVLECPNNEVEEVSKLV